MLNEVKTPKKPLIYYYGVMLLILLLFNFFGCTLSVSSASERSGLWNIYFHDRE